jgi:hypothetical protein
VKLRVLRGSRFKWQLLEADFQVRSVRHHTSGIRAIQYLRLIVFRARACSSTDNMRAVAATSAPVTLPPIVQGATRTCGLFRIRFVFPISLRVIT